MSEVWRRWGCIWVEKIANQKRESAKRRGRTRRERMCITFPTLPPHFRILFVSPRVLLFLFLSYFAGFFRSDFALLRFFSENSKKRFTSATSRFLHRLEHQQQKKRGKKINRKHFCLSKFLNFLFMNSNTILTAKSKDLRFNVWHT